LNLALFDFDGTITHADMYTKFLHFSGTKRRAMLAKVILPPFYLLYKAGIIPTPKMSTSEDLAMLNLADEAYLNWKPYTVGAAH
jgi:hypothetical protein